MTEVYPSYYPQFRCRAGVCKNTCCRGWEIDIDSETREFYRTVGGDLGQKLRQSILDGEDGASLRLTEDERCPFLLDSGLCQLILELVRTSSARSAPTTRDFAAFSPTERRSDERR